MEDSVLGLIQRLARLHIESAVGEEMHARYPRYGQKPFDQGKAMKKLVIKAYGILLTCHPSDTKKEMTEFDRLYAIGCQLSLQNKIPESEKLASCTHRLRRLDSGGNGNLRDVTTFLLNLRQEESSRDWNGGFVGRFKSPHDGDHYHFPYYPSHVFETLNTDWTFSPITYNDDMLDAKVFSLPPGFATPTTRLKCCEARPASDDGSSSLFGALVRPSSDPWKIVPKLEIPDLSDDPTSSETWNRWSLQNWDSRLVKTTLVAEKGVPPSGGGQRGVRSDSESDEGFQETDTPTSGASSGRVDGGEDIWSLALTEDYLRTPRVKARTWEALERSEPVDDKLLLTEAGPEALDHLILSQRQELLILFPDLRLTFASERKCGPSELFRHIFDVLLGIGSRTFPRDEDTGAFIVAPISVSGFSPEGIRNLLAGFAGSGTDHSRLEKFSASCAEDHVVGGGGGGQMSLALKRGVQCYLRHRQVAINSVFRPYKNLHKVERQDLNLLRLVDRTAPLCRQTRYLAELCRVVAGADSPPVPSGMALLSHLYQSCLDSSCDPHASPVALSMLLRAAEPYLDFLRKWAFEGRCEDHHWEFPIGVDWESEDGWGQGFVLEEADDPILKSMLRDVFGCGKSLILLKRCCPSHPLCRQSCGAPALRLVFQESELETAEKKTRDYVADVARAVRRMKESLLPDQKSGDGPVASIFSDGITRARKPEATTASSTKSAMGRTETVVQADETQDPVDQDINANPVLIDMLDRNANESLPHDVPEMDHRVVETPGDGSPKGTKRKQDRDSIDFEVLEARKPRLFQEIGVLVEGSTYQVLRSRGRNTHGHASDSTIQKLLYGPTYMSPGAIADQNANVESPAPIISRTPKEDASKPARTPERRIPERSSTPERMTSTRWPRTPENGTPERCPRSPERVTAKWTRTPPESPRDLMLKQSWSSRMAHEAMHQEKEVRPEDDTPFGLDFARANLPPSDGIVLSCIPRKSTSASGLAMVEEDFWSKWTLPVLFDRCIGLPLRAQISLVESALLDHFRDRLGLLKQLAYLQTRFFMQDGEFSQCLCHLLFQQFSRAKNPSSFLNPATLNTVLSKAVLYSQAPSSPAELETEGFDANLSFVVRYMPQSFHQASPGDLDCLQLTYHVGFPLDVVLSRSALRHYERVFRFLLQLRYCVWATTDVYEILKAHDPGHQSFAPPAGQFDVRQYRFLQMYRHEMHHFLNCLLEHLNLHVFQELHLKLLADVANVQNLQQLIALHADYLQKVSFRCLLHKKTAPLMRVLRKIFGIIVTFRSRLVEFTKAKRARGPDSRIVTGFSELQATHKEFTERSTFLFRVVSRLARDGYQTPLREFLTKLDFNGWYSSVSSESQAAAVVTPDDGDRRVTSSQNSPSSTRDCESPVFP